jgi:hypothetical protein
VPLAIDAGSGVRRFAIRVAFASDVVGVVDATLSTLAGDGTLDVSQGSPGEIMLAGSLAAPMNLGGSLVDIVFEGVGPCKTSTNLTISSCVLDDGAIGCQPQDGSVVLSCGVGGRIKNGGGPGKKGNSDAIAGVVVTMSSADGSLLTETTDESGQFEFGQPNDGRWTIEVHKTGDIRSAVSALDAALVLGKVAGKGPMNAMQMLACDVTGDGTVSALDAVRILQVAIGQIQQLPVASTCGSDWVFVPDPLRLPHQHLIPPQASPSTCQPGGIMFDPLPGDAPGQDFLAAPYGDCTGNWTPASAHAKSLQRARDMSVAVGPARPRSNRWQLPVSVGASDPFQAVEGRIAYDAAAAVPTGMRGVGAARDALVRYWVEEPGSLAFALASGTPLPPGNRPIAVVLFERTDGKRRALRAGLLSASVDEAPAGPAN